MADNQEFTAVLKAIQVVLAEDSNLQTFSDEHWQKSITPEIKFKHRREVPFSDLPIIMITRPEIRDRQPVAEGRKAAHTVRLYAGFPQKDPAQAALEAIEFEERIDDALTRDRKMGGLVLDLAVKDSVNDEGKFHPAYFCVMDVDVTFWRRTKET